jgi:hypothetical protein
MSSRQTETLKSFVLIDCERAGRALVAATTRGIVNTERKNDLSLSSGQIARILGRDYKEKGAPPKPRARVLYSSLQRFAELCGVEPTSLLAAIESGAPDNSMVVAEQGQLIPSRLSNSERTVRISPEDMKELLAAIGPRNGLEPDVLEPLFAHLDIRGLTADEMRDRAAEAIQGVLNQASVKISLARLVESSGPGRVITPLPIPELRAAITSLQNEGNYFGALSLAFANLHGSEARGDLVVLVLQYALVTADAARLADDLRTANDLMNRVGDTTGLFNALYN